MKIIYEKNRKKYMYITERFTVEMPQTSGFIRVDSCSLLHDIKKGA